MEEQDDATIKNLENPPKDSVMTIEETQIEESKITQPISGFEPKGFQKPPQPLKIIKPPPFSSQSPVQRKKRFDSQIDVLNTSFENTNPDDIEKRVTLLHQKQAALKARLDEVHGQDMRLSKHYIDFTEEFTRWNGQLEQKTQELEAKMDIDILNIRNEINERQKQHLIYVTGEIDRVSKQEQDLREEFLTTIEDKIGKHGQILQARMSIKLRSVNEELKVSVFNQLDAEIDRNLELKLDEKVKKYFDQVITEKLRNQDLKISKLTSDLAGLQKTQERLHGDIGDLTAINQNQLEQLKKDFGDQENKLWEQIKEMFVRKTEYNGLDLLTHQLAKDLEACEKKCETAEKKLAFPQLALDLNEKRLEQIEKGIMGLQLTKDDHLKELGPKFSAIWTEFKLLNGKVSQVNENLQNWLNKPQTGDPQIQLLAAVKETQQKLRKEIFDQLEEINRRLHQSEKKIETIINNDSHQRAFFDPKIIKEMKEQFKLQVEHCLNAVEDVRLVDFSELEKRQSQVETALLNQDKPQYNTMIIDAFQQKVNDMINSLQNLREENALEMAELSARLEKFEKLQNTEIEKLRTIANEVLTETSTNSKFSSLEGKIRELAEDFNREQQRITGIAQQQSTLSLQINEHTQNFTFFQSQTKGYQSREELNTREWRHAIENSIKSCQSDIKEITMFLESHQVGIKSLDGLSEETRKEVLWVKTVCSNLDTALKNVNNDLQVLLDNQNKIFMQKIKETVDALQSNSERFMSLLTLEARKTDERFLRLDDNISNLLRNSLHLSRSFEEEEENKESKRISPRIQESRSSHPEGHQGRFFSGKIQDSKIISPLEEGYRSGLKLSKATDEETQPSREGYRSIGGREGYRSRLAEEHPSEEQSKTSILQPQSHQQLLSLLPQSSTKLPSSTLQHSQVQTQHSSTLLQQHSLQTQPLHQTSTIVRESASESTQKKISQPQTGTLKRNIVADLYSSKNRPKRL